jgi:hypothetical protein
MSKRILNCILLSLMCLGLESTMPREALAQRQAAQQLFRANRSTIHKAINGARNLFRSRKAPPKLNLTDRGRRSGFIVDETGVARDAAEDRARFVVDEGRHGDIDEGVQEVFIGLAQDYAQSVVEGKVDEWLSEHASETARVSPEHVGGEPDSDLRGIPDFPDDREADVENEPYLNPEYDPGIAFEIADVLGNYQISESVYIYLNGRFAGELQVDPDNVYDIVSIRIPEEGRYHYEARASATYEGYREVFRFRGEGVIDVYDGVSYGLFVDPYGILSLKQIGS